MAENTLKLRVDVETATLKQLTDEVARLKAQLANLDPQSAEFQEAAESYRQAKDRQNELTDAIVKGNGHLRALAEALDGVGQSEADVTQKKSQLIAESQKESATLNDLSATLREMEAVRKGSISTTDLLSGKEQEFQAAIVSLKDRINEANQITYSGNAKSKESYFQIGEQLRRLAAEGGGYVSNLQIQQQAQTLAAQSGISQAEAMKQVEAAMRQAGIQTQSLTGFIRTQRTENRMQNFLLHESSQAITSVAGSVSNLSASISGQTMGMKALDASLNQAVSAFSGLDFAIKGLGASLGKTGAAWAAMGLGVAGGLAVFVGITEAIKQANAEIDKLADEKAKKLVAPIPKMGIVDIEKALEASTEKSKQLTEQINAYYRSVGANAMDVQQHILLSVMPPKVLMELKAAREAEDKHTKALQEQLDALKTNPQALAQYTEALFQNKQITEADYVAQLNFAKALAGGDKNLKDIQPQLLLVGEIEKKLSDLSANAAKKKIEDQLKVVESIFKVTNASGEYVKSLKELEAQAHASKLPEIEADLQRKITEFQADQSKKRLENEKKNLLEITRATIGLQDALDERTSKLLFQRPGTATVTLETIFKTDQKDTNHDLEVGQELLRQYSPLVDSLMSGFDELGSAIQSGLVNMLGEANSLFQKFVSGVLQGIAQIMEKIAASGIIAGILSLIIPGAGVFGSIFGALTGFAGGGMITEPIVGMGMQTGRAYTFGEQGKPELVLPMNESGRFESVLAGSGRTRAAREISLPFRDFDTLINSAIARQIIEIRVSGSSRIAGRDIVTSFSESRILARKKGQNI